MKQVTFEYLIEDKEEATARTKIFRALDFAHVTRCNCTVEVMEIKGTMIHDLNELLK